MARPTGCFASLALGDTACGLLAPDGGPLEPPIRAVQFGAARFAEHGRSLAREQAVAGPLDRRGRSFFPRLQENLRVLREARLLLEAHAAQGHHLAPAAGWLIDHGTLLERTTRTACAMACRGGYLPPSLPRLRDEPLAGLPRIYSLAWAFVAHTDSRPRPAAARRHPGRLPAAAHTDAGRAVGVAGHAACGAGGKPAPAGRPGPGHPGRAPGGPPLVRRPAGRTDRGRTRPPAGGSARTRRRAVLPAAAGAAPGRPAVRALPRAVGLAGAAWQRPGRRGSSAAGGGLGRPAEHPPRHQRAAPDRPRRLGPVAGPTQRRGAGAVAVPGACGRAHRQPQRHAARGGPAGAPQRRARARSGRGAAGPDKACR
jgi:hypothetical protein